MPALDVETPPVRRGRGRRGERAPRDRPPGLAGAGQHGDHEEREGQRHGAGEEAGEQPRVGLEQVVVLVAVARPALGLVGPGRGVRGAGGGLGGRLGEGRGAAPLGHVGGLVGQRGGEIADEVEAVAVGHPPGREQRRRAVGIGPQPAPLPPRREQLARAGVDRQQRGQLVEGLADGADQQEADHPHQRPAGQPEQPPGQRPRATVDQQRPQRRPALLVVRVPPRQRRTPAAAVGRLGVEHHGLRHHDGAVAGGRGTPAEVHVVAEDRQVPVEAAELAQQLAAHEHAGGVDGQHAAYVVVLALVVLAALQTRSRADPCRRW